MTLELLAFDGLAARSACSIHRAIWGDAGEVFVLDGTQRRSIEQIEFERARAQRRLTEVRPSRRFEQPQESVLLAPNDFLSSDGITLDAEDVPYTNETPPLRYAVGSSASLREIVAGWGLLATRLEASWGDATLTTSNWLHRVRRLQSIATVSERDDLRCTQLALLSLLAQKDKAVREGIEWELDLEFSAKTARRAAVQAAARAIVNGEGSERPPRQMSLLRLVG
jgi:hypothetical protein